MFTQFEILNISHQLVLEKDTRILEVVGAKKQDNVVKIFYSTQDSETISCQKISSQKFRDSRLNLASQIVHTQKYTYKKGLIISNLLAQSLTFCVKDSRKYILIDENYKAPVETQQDYRKLILSLNTWRFKAPIFRKALAISVETYRVVNDFANTFSTNFNHRYYSSVTKEIEQNLKFAHDFIVEELMKETLICLRFYEKRLSILQLEKIEYCVLKILKNWLISDKLFHDKFIIDSAIRMINKQQIAPHLDKNVEPAVLFFHLKRF